MGITTSGPFFPSTSRPPVMVFSNTSPSTMVASPGKQSPAGNRRLPSSKLQKLINLYLYQTRLLYVPLGRPPNRIWKHTICFHLDARPFVPPQTGEKQRMRIMVFSGLAPNEPVAELKVKASMNPILLLINTLPPSLVNAPDTPW